MNEETQEVQTLSAPGVLIDNNTGQTDEPHPLTVAGLGADTTEEVEDTDTGESKEEVDTPTEKEEDLKEGKTETQEISRPVQSERVEDPGEFQPNDYSFDVTLADGSVIKIEKPEDIDKLPETPEFASVKDHTLFTTNYAQMVRGLSEDRKAWESNKTAYDKQIEADNRQADFITTIHNSMNYLEKKGSLPEIPAQYATADWNDPEVAKQPGVKERIELIQYMAKENAVRRQTGLPDMTVLEAHAELKSQAFEQAQQEREQKQADMRKKRGSMVAGQSAPAPNAGNSGMIVGSGGSLRDL